jgi:60 kDa SS-A/Ro ribonucleoprotein
MKMASKTLFNTKLAPAATSTNKAGGQAYNYSDEHKLCQYVVTSTFGNLYYASAQEQLDEVKKLVANVSPQLIAKAAVYGHEVGNMKDVPAFLLASLISMGHVDLFRAAFPRVITNTKMLLNFVQIIRSGQTGRRSFGSVARQAIRDWLTSKTPQQLLSASIGYSDPSLADVIKMVHPSPRNSEQSSVFAYLLGKDVDTLPDDIQYFEDFKRNPVDYLDVPKVPFQALSNLNLTTEQWKNVGRNMPWNTLRMNLNTLARHGVFKDKDFVKEIAAKLRDTTLIDKVKVFPYQLYTAYQNIVDVPNSISVALQDAAEYAVKNVPNLGEVACCIDLSGSMHSPVTGNRPGATTKTMCVDVAALVASCIVRKNPDAKILAWASLCTEVKVNPKDSILTNAQNFARVQVGGGTCAQLGMAYLNHVNWKGDVVIYVSDNQSWIGSAYSGTPLANEWKKYKSKNKSAKLVCIDITPYGTSQVPDDNSVLNIGGFSDNVWPVIENFVKGSNDHFVQTVQSITL